MGQSVKQCRSYRLALGMAACALVLMLAVSSAGLAQQAASSAGMASSAGTSTHATLASVPVSALESGAAQVKSKPAGEEEEETAKPGKPGSEGIKVHGHWVIDVRNPDGTLVAHRDFHNSLVALTGTSSQPTGDQILAALLSGNAVAGDPAILFIQGDLSTNSDPSSYCKYGGGNQLACWAFGNSSNVAYVYGTGYGTPQAGLTATVSLSPSVNWVLTGNYTIPAYLTAISAVQTSVPLCVSEFTQTFANGAGPFSGTFANRTSVASPSSCSTTYSVPASAKEVLPSTLTSTVLQNPLTGLVAGQVITVTVTLSFS